MKRKGLGKSLGMGYKNLAIKDPYIHSLSARGIKSQRPILYAKSTQLVDWALQYDVPANLLGQIQKEKGDIESIEEFDGLRLVDAFLLVIDDEEYILMDEDDAESKAYDYVREQLEEEPENFEKSWLQQFIYIGDTDRRMIADEESDARLDGVSDEDLIEDYADLTQKDDYEEYDFGDKCEEEDADEKMQEIVEKVREEAQEQIYDEVYDALEDPVQYFVNDQGIYTEEDLFKQGFVSIDYDEATKNALDVDGWGHFVAPEGYDEYSGGKVLIKRDDFYLA